MRYPLVDYRANASVAWQTRSFWLFAKRLADVCLSALLLVLLLPLLAFLALLIRLDSRGPIIFKQERIGRQKKMVEGSQNDTGSDGHPESLRSFTFYKFRSMHTNSGDACHREYVEKFISGEARPEENGSSLCYKLSNDKRVTRIGRILRSTSLDEIPQLFNVLRGDMSLVGPRPPLPYEVAIYQPHHWRRLEVLPGITGLWQVRGRSRVTFDEMVDMDLEYIDHWSFWLDLKILSQTLPAVIRGDGAG